MLRYPQLFDAQWNLVTPEDFSHPTYRALFAAIAAADRDAEDWAHSVATQNSDPVLADIVVTLMVEPVLREATVAYAAEYAGQVRLRSLAHRIAELKSKLQRTDPTADTEAYAQLFARLVELESDRKALVSLVAGASAATS